MSERVQLTMATPHRKRLLLVLAIATGVVLAYVGSYLAFSAAGEYHPSRSGKLRYVGGISVTDCEHWQPKFMWWEPFRDLDGNDTSRGNWLGGFYSPLIRVDRAWCHPSHDLLAAIASDQTPLAR